jgi:hypothetical protein
MNDRAEETVPCHYCGAEVEVPTDRSRFEAFTAHFQTEHIHNGHTTPRPDDWCADLPGETGGHRGGTRDAGD